MAQHGLTQLHAAKRKIAPIVSAEDLSFRAWCEGLETLSRLGSGAIVLGAGGEVLFANAAARQHFGYGIMVTGQQLVATDRASNDALQDLIKSITAQEVRPIEQKVAIARHGEPPLLAYVVPTDQFTGGSYGVRGILMLVDPQGRSEPTLPLLQQVFGFTAAEARLAVGLLRGMDLQEIAELYGVSVGTLRVQLKSIFAKTETNRQAQLVALLAKLQL